MSDIKRINENQLFISQFYLENFKKLNLAQLNREFNPIVIILMVLINGVKYWSSFSDRKFLNPTEIREDDMFVLWRIALAELLLAVVCLVGDILSQNENILPLIRALCDSGTHGAVGVIAWFISADNGSFTAELNKEMILCGVLASLVDVDHFIAARSLSLSDALSLPTRPPFHNSTLIIIIPCVMALVDWFIHSSISSNLALIFTTAWFTHHVRDANRRGLWFAPFGSTPALPCLVYIGIIMCTPLAVRCFISISRKHEPLVSPTLTLEQV